MNIESWVCAPRFLYFIRMYRYAKYRYSFHLFASVIMLQNEFLRFCLNFSFSCPKFLNHFESFAQKSYIEIASKEVLFVCSFYFLVAWSPVCKCGQGEEAARSNGKDQDVNFLKLHGLVCWPQMPLGCTDKGCLILRLFKESSHS